MATDPTSASNEIADLLRERLALAKRAQEYQEERRREAEEVLGKLKVRVPKLDLPDLPKFDRQAHDKRMAELDERTERM